MKNYIVKSREYDDSGLLSYGTGIVIGNGTAILTAAHVICGSKHCVIVVSEKGEVEIETQLLQKNKVAAILSANSSLHCESANIFSNQENGSRTLFNFPGEKKDIEYTYPDEE